MTKKRWEIRERAKAFGDDWRVVAWFTSYENARKDWKNVVRSKGLRIALVEISYTEQTINEYVN